MNFLDMRTVLVSYAVSSFLCVFVMAMLWRQNRRRFAGIGLWLASYTIFFIGVCLMALRGVLPDVLSLGGGSPLIIGGQLAMLMGMEAFTGLRLPRLPNWLLLAAATVLHEYFAFVSPDLTVRNHIVSVAALFINAQCAYVMLRADAGDRRLDTRGLALVFLAFCAVCLFRIGVDCRVSLPSDFMRSHSLNTLAIMVVQMLHVVLAFSLFLMINKRLFVRLEDEIAMRELTEVVLRESEEKFHKAFNESPDAVILARLEDGRLVEVNEGFCRQYGYVRDEVIGRTSIELGLWVDARKRDDFRDAVTRRGGVRDWEGEFRDRSGIVVAGLVSAEVIDVGKVPHILTMVRDITERKQAERILRIRAELWEQESDLSVRELMRRGLDEVEALTGSGSGFFQLLDEDRAALDRPVGSGRTSADAGVWAQCARTARPVVHEDGDAPHRTLIVPAVSEGRVTAVLGVCGKPAAYTEPDVQHALFIANMAWSIVEHKQTHEHILRLNKELERQAMTDELTGLENRRAFFDHGREEVRRAWRYDMPLSLLLLDLDEFKAVNDTYGHEAGDVVLQSVAAVLRQCMREIDIAGRLGGEEFCVLLPNTDGAAAATLAERLRAAIQDTPCIVGERQLRVTASIGVSGFDQDAPNLEAMLQRADAAMYRAKGQGRNRVVDGA